MDDKIIAGLESCLDNVNCDGCPYENVPRGTVCHTRLHADALIAIRELHKKVWELSVKNEALNNIAEALYAIKEVLNGESNPRT